eukprot:10607356-Lingulodinium_polyedra.AAC.1
MLIPARGQAHGGQPTHLPANSHACMPIASLPSHLFTWPTKRLIFNCGSYLDTFLIGHEQLHPIAVPT